MIDFLYKSSLSLLLLLVIYHLVFEKQKMHNFKRFYLLFSLVFSFVLPFIAIPIDTEISKSTNTIQQTYHYLVQNISDQNQIAEVNSYDYKMLFLGLIYGLIYGLITMILMFRYVQNIVKIVLKTKSNTIISYQNASLVLLEEQTLPHTFLNFIFVNKTDYQNRKIEEQLYGHELVHVCQKHTLDVLFVETLKIFFWFNPLFIFYKKAIQLNHEFLADENVVTSFNDVPFYQNLLLSHSNADSLSGLTSNLNYSITKKRFIMMTKTVSKTKVLLSKVALLPFLFAFTFFMCAESIAKIKNTVDLKLDKKTNLDKSVLSQRPQIRMHYAYNQKTKIKEDAIQGLMNQLGVYIGNNYKTTEGVERKNEIARFKFLLDNTGNISDIQIFEEQGNETEAKLLRILQSRPKKGSEKKSGDGNWEPIEIQMDFLPKNPDDTADNPIHVVYGVFALPGTMASEHVDIAPKFIGNKDKLNESIAEAYKGRKDLPNGKLSLGFVVETDGSLSSFTLISDIKPEDFDKVVQILKDTKWESGEKDGKAVRTSYVLKVPVSNIK